MSLPYNKKFSTVSSFEMRIYDADGKLLKKYHKGDLYEHSATDYESLVTDDRIMSIEHTIASYPVTVEMIYEIDNNSLIGIGGWSIQGPQQSIQNSNCRVAINADAGFRYLNKNTDLKPQKSNNGNKDIYTWQVSSLKAFKPEKGAMPWRFLPGIKFSQNKFEFYGISGDISSWQNYGLWQQNLNADVSSLSPARIAEIKKMTDTIKTDKDKARFLYKYMQQNMRYVSIQLGIGGLKPFAAAFVDEKKYGDCKALSNYMRALLNAVNINSYYTMINAGANAEPATSSFPSDPFNHVILCIPFKNDTTWLECTSNTMPFGKLGPFTENRSALIVTEDGGKLVNTPKSKAVDNQFNSEVHIILNTNGSAKAHAKILSTGELRSIFVDLLPTLKIDEQKQSLIRNFDIKQPSEFDFKSGPDLNNVKEVNLDLEYDKFCDVMTADKQFYRPWALALWDATVPIIEKRKTDFYFEYPLQESCVTTIDLPDGFEIEALPANSSLKFTYGNYDLNYVYNKDKNQIISNAKFVLNSQIIPAFKYTEMQQYMDAVLKAQNKKLVIKRRRKFTLMIFRLDQRLLFPDTVLAEEDGLLAVGGDLSIDRLLLAYQSGIFPWYNDDTPILWYSPNERFVLFPEELRISKSMRQVLRSGRFKVTIDQCFEKVIDACSIIPRDGQDGTWITTDMKNAYIRLHHEGHAHSVEVWEQDQLVGGLYGVQIGSVFCGESMFALVSNASKIALINLCNSSKYTLIDCQVHTAHLESMGAKMICQKEYMAMLTNTGF